MELHEQCNGLRDTLRANILNLNLGFLITAQQLVLNGCPSEARLFLGVREPLLSWLRNADVTTLCTLARSPDLRLRGAPAAGVPRGGSSPPATPVTRRAGWPGCTSACGARGATMNKTDEIANTTLAMRLLTRDARISIVHHETGLTRGHLRALYRDLHGRSAPSGQLPAIGCAMITTRREQVLASLFAACTRCTPDPPCTGR